MKQVIKCMGLAICLLLICSSEVVAGNSDYVPGEVLLKFKGSTGPVLSSTATALNNTRARVTSRMRARVLKRLPLSGIEHWKLPAGMSVETAVQQLRADPNVEYAEPNYRRYLRAVPNDPSFSLQWGLQNSAQNVNTVIGVAGADMGLTTAWATQTGSQNVIVAVVDDSVDINHPDLAANIWINPGEIAGDGIDNDGNGYIDDVKGWDFKNSDADPSADPGTVEGHGTRVAGCVGAIGNNGLGISGVNWNVSIMPLKFNMDIASEIAAFDYAIANGAHIINASFGGPGSGSIAEQQAVQRLQNAGILLVVAAGNNDGDNDIVPDAPSGYTNANILAVAASTSSDILTEWSHYGATSVDVAAPGENIYTTTVLNGYGFTAGSSFSAPYVAGIAALLKAQYPTATFQELKGRIIASVTPVVAMQGLVASGGRADAAFALTVVAQPALLISNVIWSDGGNNMMDPSETATMSITLNNVWANAVGISATITPLSANLMVNSGVASYPNISSGSSHTANFNLSTTAATGHQVYKFKLDISAAGGYSVTRYYQIGMGALGNGVNLNGTLGTNAQDDYQLFFVDVPAGASNLTVNTTSVQDLDLMLTFNGVPAFDFANYWLSPPIGTQMAVTLSGNESVGITNPAAGLYSVLVLNPNKVVSTLFTVQTNITAAAPIVIKAPATPAPVAAAGGGCTISQQHSTDPILLFLLLLSATCLIRRRQVKSRV